MYSGRSTIAVIFHLQKEIRKEEDNDQEKENEGTMFTIKVMVSFHEIKYRILDKYVSILPIHSFSEAFKLIE